MAVILSEKRQKMQLQMSLVSIRLTLFLKKDLLKVDWMSDSCRRLTALRRNLSTGAISPPLITAIIGKKNQSLILLALDFY